LGDLSNTPSSGWVTIKSKKFFSAIPPFCTTSSANIVPKNILKIISNHKLLSTNDLRRRKNLFATKYKSDLLILFVFCGYSGRREQKFKIRKKEMNILKSKVLKSGVKVSIVEAGNGKKEYFALSKKYWIAYGEGSPRNCRNRSNDLKYLEKKFEEIQ
jgi:hypothetical protein